jgi:ABC-type bacteriocin/lantibiotic exporter with double-glycine peptidase domain
LLTSRAMGGFSSIVMLIIRYREFQIALRELNQTIPTTRQVSHKSRGRLQGAVRVDHVTCRLQQGDGALPVLKDVSLSIAPGEIVGIAGSPGAGKTTLLRLIAGVLQPDEGRILIDNIPLNELSHDDISLNIGLKPQDFCLIDGSIEDNVRAGRTQLSADVRQSILAVSGLSRAFQENGLNWSTEIGPRGSNISGGQRQLVSLARAMLYQPTILMLDEPTNGLDAQLEGNLVQQIAQMKGRNTVIISTHSRNILSICDRIIVIGQSRILADGPRDKVLVG